MVMLSRASSSPLLSVAASLAGSLLAFALTFGATAFGIRQALPFPEVSEVREKIAHFQSHADDYDALLLGSSRIAFQVLPSVFDRVAGEAGHPTKTFNAGIAGMRSPEDAFYFDQLLQGKPRNLRWVFLELNGIRTRLDGVTGTLRAQYWHDFPRLWLIWRRLTYLPPAKKRRTLWRTWSELREPLAAFPEHLGLFAREMVNLGRARLFTSWLMEKPEDWRRNLPVVLGENMAGWHPAGAETISERDLAKYEGERAERLAKPAVHDLADPVSQDALAQMIARIERLGAQPVLVIPPVTAKKAFYSRPDLERRCLVLEFNDPRKYPELYEPKHRLDTEHLNTAGSRVFTRLLAREWLAAVEARKSKP